ncbi:MAG: PaaI family thioesterase [Actinomycetota bacterium]|nr:PaaI family thioesterase [Actinomycetota bacterium]
MTSLVPQAAPGAPPPGTVLGQHYAGCFGCGEAVAGGLHLRVKVGEGVRVAAEFQVGPQHQGAPGLAHGGVLSSAFDEALGALLWLLRTPGVTRRLDVEFLRPVPVGATLHIGAECLRVEGRKIFSAGEGRLDAADGPIALRAEALFIAVPLTHFTGHGGDGTVMAARYNP